MSFRKFSWGIYFTLFKKSRSRALKKVGRKHKIFRGIFVLFVMFKLFTSKFNTRNDVCDLDLEALVILLKTKSLKKAYWLKEAIERKQKEEEQKEEEACEYEDEFFNDLIIYDWITIEKIFSITKYQN